MDDYHKFLFESERRKKEFFIYEEPLNQIKHFMESNPKDNKYIVNVTMPPHLDEKRLAILTRDFLHVNIEFRIVGLRYDVYGNKLLSCIINNFTKFAV